MVYLEAACFAAQANDINLTAFHRGQGGQSNEHPLLGTVEETHSIQRLTEDERLHLDAYRKARAANEIRPPSDVATEAS